MKANLWLFLILISQKLLFAQHVIEIQKEDLSKPFETPDKNAKAEYYVNLPDNYNPEIEYPLIIVLHGGVGNSHSTFTNWNSKIIKKDCISVFPQGRIIKDSYRRRYGSKGIEDITEIYKQVIDKYPVDTSKVILAGQSLGGFLSLQLAYEHIHTCGLFLAFTVRPKDFDFEKAISFKNRHIKIYMICGEKDRMFFPGQKKIAEILSAANVEHTNITYPELGHGFPDDFPEQLDKGIIYLTNE